MTIRKLVLVVAMTMLTLPSLVVANHEHRATVVMRNGDRVSGNLDGVGKGLVYVRVGQEDQRQLPMNDVLLIDLVSNASGLPDTELTVAARPEHLVVFKNGTSWTGQFLNTVGGTDHNEPHQILFRTGNEDRRMNLDQVGRIYLGNYPFNTASAPAATPNVPAGAITVPANAGWTATNLIVRRGQRLAFSVSGQIQLSDDAGDTAVSAGNHNGRKAPGAPLPEALAGALIGKVGNSAPFPIGNMTTPLEMPANGQLFLGVNDDHVNDNRGEFIVQIQNLGLTRR